MKDRQLVREFTEGGVRLVVWKDETTGARVPYIVTVERAEGAPGDPQGPVELERGDLITLQRLSEAAHQWITDTVGDTRIPVS